MPVNHRTPDMSNLSKRELLQGVIISAITAVTIKIPLRLKTQAILGMDTPRQIRPDWFLQEMLRIMRDVFHLDITHGTPEYELCQLVAENNCDIHNKTQRMMAAIAHEGPIDLEKMRAIYGL